MTTSNNDTCILVDEHDVQMGVSEKFAVHRNPAKRHRAASVWLCNDSGEVLFQQRSSEKIVGALWWGNTICGNVRVGETAEECAHRRLLQELGITGVKLEKKGVFEYKAYGNNEYSEHEIDHVFTGSIGSSNVVPIPSEVAATAWIPFEELQKSLLEAAQINEYISAKQTLELTWEALRKRTAPLHCSIGDAEYMVAPWTVFMFCKFFA